MRSKSLRLWFFPPLRCFPTFGLLNDMEYLEKLLPRAQSIQSLAALILLYGYCFMALVPSPGGFQG